MTQETLSLAEHAQRLLSPTAPPDCWEWHRLHVATAPSSEGGRTFSLKRARIFKHWHQVISARLSQISPAHDPYASRAEQIWIITGTQIGKDRSLANAALAYGIDCYPRSIGYVMPRGRDLAKMLRGRIKPLITNTPRLARLLPVSESARQDAMSNTMLQIGAAQVYPLAGGVANDLRSTPMRFIIVNEFDIFPAIVQEEGDPLELVMDRMKSYPRDRLILGVTTPTLIDSHGQRRLVMGSHERLLIACLACGAHDFLNPDYIRPTAEGLSPGDILAGDLARWHCKHCDHGHNSDDKDRMIAAATEADGFTETGGWVPGTWKVNQDNPDGKWIPAADVDPATGRIRSFTPVRTDCRSGWLNSLYSEDISIGRFLHHELVAKDGGETTWRTHVNTWRAEPWLPRVEPAPTTEAITASCSSTYPRYTAPLGAQRLAVICDQQGNQIDACWFPFVVRAWGAYGESWQVDAGEVHGWDELEQLETKTWTIAGASRAADALTLDGANGTMRIRIQTWAAANPRKRFILRGVQVLNAPWIERKVTQSRERRNKRIVAGARVFSFDSTGWKNELDLRIRNGAKPQDAGGTKKLTPPWHLPMDPSDTYLQSLTSEERVLAQVRIPGEGIRPIHVWKPRAVYDHKGDLTYRSDNHWWDAETMALVAADILGWNKLAPPPPAVVAPAAPPMINGAGSWIDTSSW